MSWHHLAVDDENAALHIADETKKAALVAMFGPQGKEVAISSSRAVGETVMHFYFSPAVAAVGRAHGASPCGKPTLKQAGGLLIGNQGVLQRLLG